MNVNCDSEILDWLINWFSFNDTFEGSGVRDWNDNNDARRAISKAMQAHPPGKKRQRTVIAKKKKE